MSLQRTRAALLMKQHTALCCLILLSLATGQIRGSFQTSDAIPLSEYNSYADVQLSVFNVPDAAVSALWMFDLLTKSSSCPPRNASIYLQYGGYPLVNPLGELYPPQFYLNRTWPFSRTINSTLSDTISVVLVNSPRKGKWFVAAFLDGENTDKALHPAGLMKQCQYFFKPTMNVLTASVDNIVYITSDVLQTLFIDVADLAIIRFFVPNHAYQYEFRVHECEPVHVPNGDCRLLVVMSQSEWPVLEDPSSLHCSPSNSSNCSAIVTSPIVNSFHYALIRNLDKTACTLRLSVSIKDCSALNCLVDELLTYTMPDTLAAAYLSNSVVGPVPVSDVKPYLASFELSAFVLSGSTLHFSASAANIRPNEEASIFFCLTKDKMVFDKADIKDCSSNANLTLVWSDSSSSNLFVPYPEEGIWHLSSIAECYQRNSSAHDGYVVPCALSHDVMLNITVRPCVDTQCGKYGSCRLYYSGTLHWSACKCIAGYRGYGCTDAAVALSDGVQMLQTVLLTSSNALFGVASLLAVYRMMFPEALIYAFVLFASLFYHACDNGTLYAVCILSYNMMQYCDFYGSILAVWMTFMALCELSAVTRTFLNLAGVLGVLVGTQYSLHGLWNFAIPSLIASVILCLSWATVCRRDRVCFPPKVVLIGSLLPGTLFAVIGLTMYAFLETEQNYPYIHSAWHLVIAASVICLLPRTRKLDLRSIKRWFSQLRGRNSVSVGSIHGPPNEPLLTDHEELTVRSSESRDSSDSRGSSLEDVITNQTDLPAVH